VKDDPLLDHAMIPSVDLSVIRFQVRLLLCYRGGRESDASEGSRTRRHDSRSARLTRVSEEMMDDLRSRREGGARRVDRDSMRGTHLRNGAASFEVDAWTEWAGAELDASRAAISDGCARAREWCHVEKR